MTTWKATINQKLLIQAYKDKLPLIIQKMRFKARLEIADDMLNSILDLPELIKWQEFRKTLKGF